MADSGSGIPEKVLTELCNSYRFYADFQYRIYQLFAIGNAGLLAAYWAMRKELGTGPGWWFLLSGLLIRFSGVVVCWACYALARNLASLADEYGRRANTLSQAAMQQDTVVLDPARAKFVDRALLWLTLAVTLVWVVGFFFFEMRAVYALFG